MVASATSRMVSNGQITLDLDAGSIPFVPPSDFEATTLELIGLYGTPDVTLPLPEGLALIPAGIYSVRVYDAEGCPGVASAPGGTTFGQEPVEFPLYMRYDLCCGACGILDVDTDGVCDDIDNCIDRTSINFNHPGNIPCD